MARMIPPIFDSRKTNSGEADIFARLSRDVGTEDFIVLHSLYIAGTDLIPWAEADFVVLAPGYGVFVLEVKSGIVRREGGIWQSVDSRGVVHEKHRRSPVEQARDCMFALKNRVTELFGSNHRLARLNFGFGLVFPHVTWTQEGPEYKAWQVLDRPHLLNSIALFIQELSRNTLNYEKQYRRIGSESLPTKGDCEALLKVLRGDFEGLQTFRDRIDATEGQVCRATEEQLGILDQFAINDRCLCEGGAGTGKTILAIEVAKRAALEGNRVLLLCYNRLLGEWLKKCAKYSGHNIVACSFHEFMSSATKIKKSAGIADDEFFKNDLPLAMLDKASEDTFQKFDRLILDEGQDLLCLEYLTVFEEILTGGLVDGKWTIFCDMHRQAIFSKLPPDEMLQLLRDRGDFARLKLSINCRNPRPVAEETGKLCGFAVPLCRIEGLNVEKISYPSKNLQISRLTDLLSELTKKQVQRNEVTILSPRKYENSCVADLDTTVFPLQNLSVSQGAPVDCNAFCFSTIHAFKGLENSYIVLVDLEQISDNDAQRQLLYIGMSRARVQLYMLIKQSVADSYRM